MKSKSSSINTTRLNLGRYDNYSLLSDDELSKFKQVCHLKSNTIYCNKLQILLIKSGSAKLSFFENGKEFILNFLSQGNIALLDKNISMEFLENSEVLEISLYKVQKLLKNEKFSMSLFNSLIRQIVLQRNIIRDIVFKNIDRRLYSFLISLANEQNEFIRDKQVITLPFSIKTLSELLGFERQSVSTAFNKLLKTGFLSKCGKNRYMINLI
ncbi:Crp/Fnr family transcriptional regulator [Campylobacter hyointestinalis]|uniref:Crp/Fnr family transcriptional regulator n=1 Tax=Campylobacter hyointestinalis TaxID=198 RepID=UPI000DCB673B|nr:Crp/Fnr family transcriptional regulator [Campylobacter hyointestinalis]RAZ53485.1 Crp/Fnr family transcriptional regulator [Campylobacter hyointestinalis subsp. lawsonii]RAZ62150.1 Crp/Fnr family transcriptional regulator [Campylobacter hyointestinalis subsp. lawsonii]